MGGCEGGLLGIDHSSDTFLVIDLLSRLRSSGAVNRLLDYHCNLLPKWMAWQFYCKRTLSIIETTSDSRERDVLPD